MFGVGRAGLPTPAYVLLGGSIFIVPIVASHIALAFVGAWLAGAIIMLSGYLFFMYFSTLDLDPNLTKRNSEATRVF